MAEKASWDLADEETILCLEYRKKIIYIIDVDIFFLFCLSFFYGKREGWFIGWEWGGGEGEVIG